MTGQNGTTAERARSTHDWVMPTAATMLVVQLAFRAWAAWSSWYFLDDLTFLRLSEEAADWTYLTQPYSGHLMPGGKLIMWAIGTAGSAQWWPAALFLVVGQGLASAACLWMLVSLFGARRAILPLFALYLFLTPSMPAYMWLVAALQQLPLQVCLAMGVGAWVRYLRGRRLSWLAVTLGAFVFGLVFWQKALFLVPLLAFLSVAYFTAGRPMRRLRGIRDQALALLAVAAVAAAYVAFYLSRVPSQFSSVTPRLTAELAETMLGTTLTTGLVGGPWRWDNPAPPNAFADPPSWAVNVAWVIVAAVLIYGLLRRQRSGRALLLATGWVLGTFLLVLTGRATSLGAHLGTDLRYVADVPLILALCLGLAFLDLPGAPGSSAAREPAGVHGVPRPAFVALLAAIIGGSLYSSTLYVNPWHNDNAAKGFFERFDAQVTQRGRTDMADRIVPEDVMSQLAAPNNNFSFLAPLVTNLVHFPDVTPELVVVGDDGSLRQADIERGVDSTPGPVEGCGWKVTEKGLDIPLAGHAIDYAWWARIGYLNNVDSPVTVSAGRTSIDTTLRQGLNNLYLRLDGEFDAVTISGLDPGTTLCVDVIEVGQAEPGAPLP